jgi:hypothetical protein
MLDDLLLPPAVVEAAARIIYQNWHRDSADLLPPWELLAEEYRTRWIVQATDALRAGLAAWPGMEIDPAMWERGRDFLILPLTQSTKENDNG